MMTRPTSRHVGSASRLILNEPPALVCIIELFIRHPHCKSIICDARVIDQNVDTTQFVCGIDKVFASVGGRHIRLDSMTVL